MDAIIRPILNTRDPVKENEMKNYIEKKFGRSYISPVDLYNERLAERNNKNFDPWLIVFHKYVGMQLSMYFWHLILNSIFIAPLWFEMSKNAIKKSNDFS